MKTRYLAGVAVLVVAGGLVFWNQSRRTEADSSVPAGAAAPAITPPELPPVERSFRDTSMLRAPAGAKVAIIEFDDLECPACAHALPVMKSAAEQQEVPLIHHDYPLTEIHTWSFDAAVTARYLQDKVSARMGDQFRSDVFAHQPEITSKDDLQTFTRRWMTAHGLAVPFVVDPDGAFTAEVKADRALGDRVGLHETPTIFVVTAAGFKHVNDPAQLESMVAQAKAEAGA